MVLGKDGQPLHGLKKEAFQVTENGSVREVTTFEEVNTTSQTLEHTKDPNLFTNAIGGGTEPRRITIILLDALNTPAQDQVQARTQLIKFLAKSVDANHMQSLLALDQRGLTQIQDFTSDPKLLVAALQQVSNRPPAMNEKDKEAVGKGAPGSLDPNPGMGTMREVSGSTDPAAAMMRVLRFIGEGQDASAARFREGQLAEQTLTALYQIANVYAGIPGRKSLVWLTGGFPFKLDDPTSVPVPDLANLYQLTVQRLSDANIAVYPVDARGLVGETYNLTETKIGTGLIGPGPNPRLAGQTIDPEGLFESQLTQTLTTVADMTGGRVFTARNDLIDGFRQVDQDSGTYYMLGYYLDPKGAKPGWRKLKVKLQGAEGKLLYREGFFATAATTNPGATKAMEIAQALHSPIDATGLAIRAKFLEQKPNGAQRDVQYLMGANPGAVVADASGQIDIEMFGIAVDAKNQPVGEPFQKSFVATLNADQAKQLAMYGLVDRGTFTLAPGTYTVHFGVRDNKTGRVGTVTAPLTVQ